MQSAGLNPALAYQQGSAATTSGATASTSAPSGAKGDVDTSATAGIVTLLGSLLSAQVSMSNQLANAANNMAIADKQTATSKYIADLQSYTTRYNAELSAKIDRYKAQLGLQGVKYSADQARAASKYTTDTQRKNVLDQLANALELQENTQIFESLMQEDRQDWDDYMKMNYPTSFWQLPGSVGNQLQDLIERLTSGGFGSSRSGVGLGGR